jgi:ribosomal protein S18 acetylase RimI-like enzyme
VTAGGVEVRLVDSVHLEDIARLHVDAFPDSVLGRLGVEAVRRNYDWQLTGPHDPVALLATDGDEVVGFLVGGRFRGSTIGFVKKEKWFLAGRVLRHPGVLLDAVGWSRISLALRLLARRAPLTQIEDPGAVPNRSFGVLAIGVSPTARGSGVGRVLMGEAAERARLEGYSGMHLTVHADNAGALSFYRGLGWVEAASNGRRSVLMTFDLRDDR